MRERNHRRNVANKQQVSVQAIRNKSHNRIKFLYVCVRTWENKVRRISSCKFDSCLGAWLNVTNKGTQTVFFFL